MAARPRSLRKPWRKRAAKLLFETAASSDAGSIFGTGLAKKTYFEENGAELRYAEARWWWPRRRRQRGARAGGRA
eukprot:1539590-Prymnesium_polylepis.2